MKKLLIYLALIAIGFYRLQAQNIDLSSLGGTQGLVITIDGETLDLATVNQAGDVNSDGFNDMLLWTEYNLYLIYGTNGTSEISLNNFDSSQGFIITEANEFAFSGTGDVNGDKIDDLIIANGDGSGVCVIFGNQYGFQNINISECATGNFGIEISGCPANSNNLTDCQLGATSVSGAGDINGDNIQDMLISVDLASVANRSEAGIVFVIFGVAGGLSNINLTTLNNTQGFSITGPANQSNIGETISEAGDVNGDGMNDIILSAYYGFPAYVIYGSTYGFSDIDLVNFNSSQGFTISVASNASIIRAVSSAGDVNGDLIDDLLLGIQSTGNTPASAYIFYGSNMMPFNTNLSNIIAAQGFSILTDQTSSFAQYISGLGDFNQDGLDDVVVSAFLDYNDTGAAYVIFGTKSYPESISVDTFPSAQGIIIMGAQSYEEAGFTISGVGDFNGDNIPDIALGTHSDIASGYVVYSPYKTPGPKSAERLGYKAFILSIVAFILCMF